MNRKLCNEIMEIYFPNYGKTCKDLHVWLRTYKHFIWSIAKKKQLVRVSDGCGEIYGVFFA